MIQEPWQVVKFGEDHKAHATYISSFPSQYVLKRWTRNDRNGDNRGPRASNGDIMANGVVDQWLQQKRI
ncbi:hypothetical protein SDJN02_01809, partial [Cucurbita argyrosperma subsp. argyrosperma]